MVVGYENGVGEGTAAGGGDGAVWWLSESVSRMGSCV